ncbi:MAG TPA: 4Fe-4S binding protein [Syntrophaceticus sp.]|nr:4Fe-4S binding protein [Syntrophaceticus sp.]
MGVKSITIDYDLCKRCGYCSAFCGKGVYKLEEDRTPRVVAQEKCTGCLLCVKRCPDFALRVEG